MPAIRSQIVATLAEFGDFEEHAGGDFAADASTYFPAGQTPARHLGPSSVSDLTLTRAYDPNRDGPLIQWVHDYLAGRATPRPCTVNTRINGQITRTRDYQVCKPRTLKYPDGKAGDGAPATLVVTLAIEDGGNRDANAPNTLLVVADRAAPDLDFIFTPNPETVDYDRTATYADVPIALDEAGPSSAGLAVQWTRNQPEMIHVEFALYAEGADDIEDDLKRLDRLQNKDPRTGEPPDLLFTHGIRTDRVRIISKSVKDQKRYTARGARQSARVTLTLRILRSRL